MQEAVFDSGLLDHLTVQHQLDPHDAVCGGVVRA